MFVKINRGWQEHERYTAEVLGLEMTIASGSQYHDPGDAVTRGHYSETSQWISDAKYTERKSFAVNAEFMKKWVERAGEQGKRFLLPLRFSRKNQWGDWEGEDYVVLQLDDFAELLEAYRGL